MISRISIEKNFYLNIENKSGSARRFELFENDKDGKTKLRGFWVNHEAKFIDIRDMRKCLAPLGITEEEFMRSLGEN